MSFDFMILGTSGPLWEVRVSEDEFDRLHAVAAHASLPQLLRADDYYGEVEYSLADVRALISELQALDPNALGPKGSDLVGQLRELLSRAATLGVSVFAAGD